MILVTGSGGFVGGSIISSRSDVIPCPSLRGKTEDEIKRIIEESGADTVIHTAAISDVRACEANPEDSYIANVQLPIYLARAAVGRKLICFSSDQVYAGAKEFGPFTEDMARPSNTYGKHKLEMENRVLDILPDAVMLRAEWMYDYYLRKSNYLMLILNATDSVRFSSNAYRGITYVKDVVKNIDRTIQLPGGVYNYGSETDRSIYDITRDFLALIGKDITVEDVPASFNLWMNTEKARGLGVSFPSVDEALIKCAKDHKLIPKKQST